SAPAAPPAPQPRAQPAPQPAAPQPRAPQARAQPARSDAAPAPRARPASARPASARSESARAEPARAESARAESARSESARAGSARPGRASPTAARPDPSATLEEKRARLELKRAIRERRRFERGEVKRFTKRSRRRRVALVTAAGFVVVLLVMLAVAVFSPILSLRTVDVRGTDRVDPATVRAAAADQFGTPLALLDVNAIGARLGDDPLIESFTTEVVPPSTLVISVVERQPVAVVAVGAQWRLVDPAGVVVQSLDTRPDGAPVLRLPAGDGIGSRAFTAEIGVLLSLPSDLRARVGWLEATTSDDVRFGLPDVGQRVFWGSADDGPLKAKVLAALIAAQKSGDKVEYNVSAPTSPFVGAIAPDTTDGGDSGG
ncbi:FtsQ-type POTRA domain-containing protein, partial [Galbitalea sp. SE-J8]|uniref:FtsQ-type POTRA domain-containing protein n=1 Tax=Galbitalea sp. SE-J8 TaxID=3054952 RepID=UPI00259CE93C